MKVLILLTISCFVAFSSADEDIEVLAFKNAIKQLIATNQITCENVDRFCDKDAIVHPHSVEAACRDTLKGFFCKGKTKGDALKELYKHHVKLLETYGQESLVY